MNIEKYYELQAKLDAHIIKKKGLKINNKLTSNKILAFKVEFGEFLNEVKFFKFWSNKPKSEDEVILEEFVDCIHFLCTVALDRGFDKYIKEIQNDFEFKDSLTDLSLSVFNSKLSSAGEFHDAFARMLTIAKKLGYTEELIQDAYNKKNDINHSRQDSDY